MRFFCFDPSHDLSANQALARFSGWSLPVLIVLFSVVCLLVGPVQAQSSDADPASPDILMTPIEDETRASVTVDDSLLSDPLDAAGVLLDALAQSEDGQAADALAREIQSVWNRSGSDAVDLLMLRASVAMRSRNFPIALDLLDTVVALAPDYAEGWNRRATVHFMRDDYASSIADVERVLRLEPRHFGALVGIGMILDDLGQDREAALFLQEALNVHPFLDNARERLVAIEARLQGTPI